MNMIYDTDAETFVDSFEFWMGGYMKLNRLDNVLNNLWTISKTFF